MRGIRVVLGSIVVILVLAALPTTGEEKAGDNSETIVSELSQSQVSITADFVGSEILVFGAIKRDSPAPDTRLDVIIMVEGPPTPVTIRRKAREMGVWVNDETVELKSAPSFFAVATTGALSRILTETEQLRYPVSVDQFINTIGITSQVPDYEDFLQGMIRIRTKDGLYRQLQNKVILVDDTLFRADINLPSNLIEGHYRVQIFLARGGKVIAHQEKTIRVRKEGIERWIYALAWDRPLLYGTLSLVMALVAGWSASTAFRLLRI